MKLKKTGLNNITVFVKFELELSDGINSVIGENGSGKTIFLKSIYDTCHSQIPRSKLSGHQICNAAELRGIRPSRQSPNIRASAAAWLVARGNKKRR